VIGEWLWVQGAAGDGYRGNANERELVNDTCWVKQ
jgi:hypothetical protein